MTVTVVLFTRDLRVRDNPALVAAHHEGAAVVPLFVVDERIVAGRRSAPNRARFLAAALAELDTELRSLGGQLVVRYGDVVEAVAEVVAEVHADSVHVAADVSWYSRMREEALRKRLAQRSCLVYTHAASVTAADPRELKPASGGDHFAVFTPYYKRWLELPLRRPLAAPRGLIVPPVRSEPLPEFDETLAESSPKLAVGGAISGRKAMRRWMSGSADGYATDSDDLAADATSRLSPYLHFGCLSAIEVLHATDLSSPGGQAFARQLAWRDFHHQVLAARPEVGWRDYRPRDIRWRDDPHALRAWEQGRTGFPIVDAGMRQLREEGWMPGRARLITASFLAKTLRIDWRIGAEHFRRWLVDADVANNQLNWQWVAGTGTDTRPNRVLNPLRQAERFDPDGEYARRWIPELRHLEGASVHRPWRAQVPADVYPAPIAECNGM
ncbi:DNA photolyase family protein [Nocardia sp. CDC159]|uniref:DNA photolyase family protein n=1 Tax=Nocardia pulmonis TaxID=2951408 RepID=A0A9X2E4F4_9NOCA|nr:MULTISPECIES: deoxyribodipyrimidine photo-lyase [Nocardia]MCM6774117.1 DNA photolyase family protein [Nocardia pulmonis]MCM6787004.1 DNA photolyase family protein [Nocardia sp. CDC159]